MENALFFVNKKKDQPPIPGEIIEIRLWKKFQDREDIVFYYSVYDRYVLNFKDFIEIEMIEFLKENVYSKIVIDNSQEKIDVDFILEIQQAAEKFNLNFNQIVFVCSDDVQEKFVREYINLWSVQIVCVNFFINVLQTNIKKFNNEDFKHKKKFSMLCRRHRPWRTYLFSKLVDFDLLENFNFSYHGVDNFVQLTDEDIILDTESATGKTFSNKFKEILKNRPFHDDTDDKDVYTEISNFVYMSDIHVTIEHDRNDEAACDPFAPGHTFVSEKTYKPIIAKKPFIVFSEPGFLKVLRQMGFKTFYPFINEEYDNILGYEVRIGEIIKEIRRITRLKKEDYENLLKQCQPIVEHNYKLAEKLHDKHSWKNV
jgi:hypothetical protein